MSVASASPDRVEPKMCGEPDLDRKLPLVREEDVGEEEVVPVGNEAEEEDEGDDRLRERKRNAQERLKIAAAVDARRIQEPRWNRGRVVDIGEKDAERKK